MAKLPGQPTAKACVLAVLGRQQGLTEAEIGRRVSHTSRAAQYALRQLKAEGLIERRAVQNPEYPHLTLLLYYLTERA